MFNETDIRRTYRLLKHKGHTEIRVIDPKKMKASRSIHVKTEDGFLKECIEHNGRTNVYVGINERRGLGTKNDQVKTINIIAFDLDSKRPKGVAATEDELKKAIDHAWKVKGGLDTRFNTKGELLMSGNGCQIWYPVNIQVGADTRKIISTQLAMFQEEIRNKYDNPDVGIDSIGDLARILKVGGTTSVKGDNTSERPWRIAKWLTDVSDEPQMATDMENYILMLKPPKPRIAKPVEGAMRQDIQWVLEHDKKLNEIYNKSPSLGDRSENEFGVICKLIFYGHDSFHDIDSVLRSAPCGQKWRESHYAYQVLTFNKALGRQHERYTPKEKVLLDQVHTTFKKWLILRDTNRIDIALATRLLSVIRGEPIWIFMIAPSGDGKTELLRAFRDEPHTQELEKITANTLVSGMEGVDDMAPKLNMKLILIWDMAQLLMMHVEEKRQIWGQLRDLYDGKAGKDTGSGKCVHYDGIYCCMLGGSTSQLDEQILIHQDLGTRELIWREEDIGDEHEELMDRVWEKAGQETIMRKELNQIVRKFTYSRKWRDITFTDDMKSKLKKLAEYTRIMRCVCKTDFQSGEVTSFAEPEMPTRILKQYKRLFSGLKNLDDDYPDEKAFNIVGRVAKSTINPVRRRIYDILKNKEDLKHYPSYTTQQIADKLRFGWKTIYKELCSLRLLKVVDMESEYDPDKKWLAPHYHWTLKREIEPE